MISIVEKVFDIGYRYPDKIALTNGKNSRSYGDLVSDILFARSILATRYGIKKGDVVLLAADKQMEFVSIYFACHLLEAVTLPIAPDTNPKRYEFIKTSVEPKLVVGFDELADEIPTATFKKFISDVHLQITNDISFPDLESLADIIFTTGTTGEPKGVQLSHKNIMAAAQNINTFIGNNQGDVELLALPISHSFGLGRMRCVLSNGQTLVLLGNFANIKRFFRFLKEYNVNGFGMVPASWAMLKKLSGDEISKYKNQLRYIEIGSAPMPIAEKKHLMELLPSTRICMHYGLTEASRSTFMEFNEEMLHLDSVGKASPNIHITIRDEDGNELPPGTEGEICVSGEAVTIGYLNMPNTDIFWENEFRTGDWGICDRDGYIYLKSRKKELINVGGKKVSPIEVEEVLNKIDFVDDCACVGIMDPNGVLGEVVKAFVVTAFPEKLTFAQMDGLIGKSLEGYKHPVVYEQIDEIPKTSSGKIQRLSLK